MTFPNPHPSKTLLLNSAFHVIRAKGYAATTVDDICEQAGMTKGSFFHHFKSKNDLFFALLDDRFRECTSPLMGEVDAALRQAVAADPLAAMAQMFKSSLVRCTKDAEWPRLYFECVAQTRDPEVRTRLADFYDRGWAMSREVTAGLKARGLAPLDADLDVSAVFWSALFDGLILAWMINPEKMDIDKLAEGIFRMLWRGIAPDAASKAGE